MSVRWSDLDAFNHVNNATYLTYLEQARLAWLDTIEGEWMNEHSMPVLAAAQVNYRKPITWPAQLEVIMYCQRVGNSSATLGHRIVEHGNPERLYCDGHVVLVWMDPASGKPVPIPEVIRSAVTDP